MAPQATSANRYVMHVHGEPFEARETRAFFLRLVAPVQLQFPATTQLQAAVGPRPSMAMRAMKPERVSPALRARASRR